MDESNNKKIKLDEDEISVFSKFEGQLLEKINQSKKTFQEIEKEIEEKNNELQQLKRSVFEQTEKWKEEASQKLEKYIGKEKTKFEKARNKIMTTLDNIYYRSRENLDYLSHEFWLKVIAIVAGYLAILFFTKNWTNWTIITISSLYLFVTALLLIRTWHLNNNMYAEVTKSHNEIKSLNIENTEYDIPTISLENTKDSKFLDRIKDIFAEHINEIGKLTIKTTPILRETLDIIKEKECYKSFVDKYVSSLQFYGFPTEGLKDKLIRKRNAISDPDVWENDINIATTEYYKKKHDFIVNDPLIFSLMFREHISDISGLKMLWREKKEDLYRGISEILYKNGLIPNFFDYTPNDLAEMLLDMEEFNIEKLRTKVYSYGFYYNFTKTYQEFLFNNEVAKSRDITFSNVYEQLKTFHDKKFDDSNTIEILLNILFNICRKNILELYPELSNNEIDGYSYLSLPMFFSNNASYLEKACKYIASNDNKIAIESVFVYLELKKQYNEEGHSNTPTIRDVMKKFNEKIKKLSEEKLNKELETLKATLASGEWINSSSRLMIKTLNKNSEILNNFRDNEHILNAIKRLFRDVKVETIERVLESQYFSAYLITYDSTEGSIRAVLDNLSNRLNGKRGSPYNFIKYTKNVMVGIVPKDYTFEKIKNKFLSDFKKELSIQNPNLKNPNLTIQRVTPSRYSFGRMNFKGMKNIEIGENVDLIEKIKDIALEEFEEEDLIKITIYDKKSKIDFIMGLLESLSVCNLIEKVTALSDKEKNLLGEMELWEKIYKAANVTDMSQLLNQIRLGNKNRVIESIDKGLKDHFYRRLSLEKNRRKVMAENLFLALSEIASIASSLE